MPDVALFIGKLTRTAKVRPAWQRYLVAVILVGAAMLCTSFIVDLSRAPYFVAFTFAVFVSSAFGGMKPGIVTVGASAVVIWFMTFPAFRFEMELRDDVARLGAFVVTGCVISVFVGAAGELQQRLDEQRQRLAVTLRSIGDAVIATDASGRVTFMNPIAEQTTGWTLTEAQGQPLEVVFRIVNEDTRAVVENPVRKVLTEGRIVGLANHTMLIRKDGSEIPIDDSAAPIMVGGHITGVVLVFRDITEAKQSQAALMRSEKLASVGRLASTIAHEINNPLEAVSNLLYLVEQDGALSTASRERIAMATSELARAAEVSRQTLSFHKTQQKRQRVQVREAVESVLRLYESRAANKQVRISSDIPSEIHVRAVPGQFRQVLSNFVTNALDAMPGGGELTIKAVPVQSERGTAVELRFTDTGVGISKAHLERIFDPFYTTKTDVGTGLGLWVAKSIVDEHEGEIEVYSETTPGRSGTTFTVRLPDAFRAAHAAGEARAD